MSEKLRNPFRMRASEKIESDVHFLRLYSPLAIEGLAQKHEIKKLWDDILFIHSSPGAGKTSLLRIFEPNSLLALYSRRSQEFKDLYSVLKKLNVFSEAGVALLGILITCTRNYEVIDDLDITDGQKKRIFYSLINSRIILSTLKGILSLNTLQFPEDLDLIKFNYKNEQNFFKKYRYHAQGENFTIGLSNSRKIFTLHQTAFYPQR